jgi:hypothetical protein
LGCLRRLTKVNTIIIRREAIETALTEANAPMHYAEIAEQGFVREDPAAVRPSEATGLVNAFEMFWD